MYIKIKKEIIETFIDYPDNSGTPAIIIFMVGCSHNCPECQNEHLQNPNLNDDTIITVDDKQFSKIIDYYADLYRTNKIVLSGGDPFFDDNKSFTINWINQNNTKYDICVYTGYTFSEIENELPSNIKYLITGRYSKDNKNRNAGKNNDNFILISKNQEIWCWTTDKYNRISKNGIITYNN